VGATQAHENEMTIEAAASTRSPRTHLSLHSQPKIFPHSLARKSATLVFNTKP
jgi:hypothetical protein